MIIGRNILNDIKFILKCLVHFSKKKCYYVGFVGYGNLGDEAMKEAIYKLFSSKIIFCYSRGMLVRLLEKIRLLKFEYLMLGGGTLLFKSQAILDKISDERIKKKVVFGTGVANHSFWKDIPNRYGHFRDWTKILNLFDYIGLRGPISKSILEKYGVKRDVNVVGDPAIFFTREIKIEKPKAKILGVNLGTTNQDLQESLMWGRDEQSFFIKIAEFLRLMTQDGWKIEFIPVWHRDIDAIEKVIKLSNKKGIGIFRDYKSVKKTMDRMESYDIFIGMKLHSVILAYCANTPAVMIEYRPKCRDFMEGIGMQNFIIRTDEFDARKAQGLISHLYLDLERYRRRTNDICKSYKNTLVSESRVVLKKWAIS